VLTGALYGLDNQLVAPDPIEGDAYSDPMDSVRLPHRWDDAIKFLYESKEHREYLGDEFVNVFCAIKRQEMAELSGQISDIEYDAYLGLL
jgi:glutamine synthetase